MFMKKTYQMSLVTLMMTFGLHASALANVDPVDVAKKQEILSQKIISAYAERRDISGVIHRLEEQQNRLKNSVHDPEISNLLDFLQLCLNNIKTISTKPKTVENKRLIADLGTSIREGNHYIAQTLQ